MWSDRKFYSILGGVIVLYFGLIGLALLAAKHDSDQFEQYKSACEVKGGEAYRPYKSKPLCVKKEQVIEVSL